MKAYRSLFKLYREQPMETVFAHFYAINEDWDGPFRIVAAKTSDGVDAGASNSSGSATSTITRSFRSCGTI